MNTIDDDRELMNALFQTVFESIWSALIAQTEKGTVYVISDYHGASFEIKGPTEAVNLPNLQPANKEIELTSFIEEALKDQNCLGIVPITEDSEQMIRKQYGLECVQKGRLMRGIVDPRVAKIYTNVNFQFDLYHKKK